MTEPLSKSQMRRIALVKQAEQKKQMTHKELLARIKDKGKDDFDTLHHNPEGQKNIQDIYKALRAVVELIEDYKTSPAIANEEFHQGILALSNVILQAIEKELG